MIQHIRIFRNTLAVLLVLLAQLVHAQNDIGITLNIIPPYSPRIDDYVETPGKVLLILRNNTQQVKNIYLQAKIKGDNGVSLTTNPNSKPGQPVVLQPNQVMQANVDMVSSLFSSKNMVYTGYTISDYVKKNGVPEGNYEICIRAYDYNTAQPLSGDAPTGCRTIPIANLEPPIPIKPLAEEEVKGLQPQNLIFSWTIPAGSEPGTQYKLRVVEMLDAKKNINDAYNSATTPTFFETITNANVFVFGPAQPALVPARKYAWAITAIPPANKKVSYKNNGRSEVRSFVFGKPEPPKPVISLLFPADNASMPPIAGLEKNKFTFKWSFTYPQAKNAVYENIEMYEVKEGQTPEQAVAKNPNCISTKEPSGSQFFNYNEKGTPDGKKFAWFVVLNDNGKIFKSEIRTFTVGVNENAGIKFSEFDLCGFPVKVTSLTEKGGYVYSGTGTTTLGPGGKEFNIKFWGATIQPFAVFTDLKTKKKTYKNWKCVASNYQYPIEFNFFWTTHINYKVPDNIGGTLWFDAKKITFTPSIKSEYDNANQVFILKEVNDYQKVELNGVFNWETSMLLFKENGEQDMLAFKSSGTNIYDYVKGFDPNDVHYMTHTNDDGSVSNKNLWLYKNGKISTELNPKLSIVNKAPKFDFYGSYTIKSPKANKPDLMVPITGDNLIGKRKITPYSAALNKDNSVIASFDSVYLDMANSQYKVQVPALKLSLTYNGATFPLKFTKAFFSSTDGLYCKEETVADGDMKVSGFPVKVDNSKISLAKTNLMQLYLSGSISVPFVNQTGGVSINVTEDGVEDANVSFDYDKETVLFQNMNGDKCTIKPSYGYLKSDRIQMYGYMNFTNVNDPEKFLNVKEVHTPDFYIKADGDVGIVNGSLDGAAIPWQVAGSYKGFKFVPYILDLRRKGNGKYKVGLKGMVVLADNLSSDSKLPNFSTSAEFDISKNTGGGPPPNQEVSFGSDEVFGGRTDATVDFGMKFKYYDGDATFGKGFSAEGYFGMQQPDPMQVHAKMLIAKAPEGFNYWFFEAGQENVMQIATGLLDLGIYGFTGRVYYKMKHSGTNIYKDDYVPNKDMFIGVYGLTQLKTLTDNGVKFWGKVAFEVTTADSWIESIKFRGDGEFASSGVGSEGMVRAHDCELDFWWEPKEIYGNFNITADFYGAVTAEANAGFDITTDAFALWASGTGYLFGSKDFSSGNFGFECTHEHINIWGNYNVVNIDKCLDLGICEPCIGLQSKLYVDAYVNYSPFSFKGQGILYGGLKVSGCRLHKTFGVKLGAQLMFPSPTCMSVGIKVKTPIKNFSVGAGVKSGVGIFWGSCF